ncbi:MULTISPECIES: hypothetical protein [Methylomonas]|uniref:Uncharacterized protein n=1 Tax=Methylomonas koyamae TaxID=702114 RepID=A0A177P4A6_9GAMM|nr:hypothetical protein [Methylomonas koyamae]OAI25075.1 hypothetical protein A1355_20100 [Methylomonas koyamae]
MSPNIKIAKAEFFKAQTLKNAVGPAAEALAKIDGAALGLSDKDAKTVADAAEIIGKIDSSAQAIIDQANSQYLNRDQNLINLASTRMFRIDSEIQEAQAHKRHAEQAHLEKTTELKKQGFNQVEIDEILDDPTPAIEAFQQKIADLGAEKIKIETFLGDAPRFDTDLLIGTTIKVAADQPAEAA